MEFKLLYELTVRCTEYNCEEELAYHKIIELDDEYVYTSDKKYSRSSLMEVEELKMEKDEMILRVYFLIKEAAIIWVREAFVKIHDKGTRAMYAEAENEWLRIMHPKYDGHWFTGGQKVEKWREEMKNLAARL